MNVCSLLTSPKMNRNHFRTRNATFTDCNEARRGWLSNATRAMSRALELRFSAGRAMSGELISETDRPPAPASLTCTSEWPVARTTACLTACSSATVWASSSPPWHAMARTSAITTATPIE